MKTLLSMILLFALLPAAQAQGITNMLRSITGAITPANKPMPAQQTAPMGIRGMDDGDVKTGAGSGDVQQLESWAVGRTEAESTAARRGLSARVVDYQAASADAAKAKGAQ